MSEAMSNICQGGDHSKESIFSVAICNMNGSQLGRLNFRVMPVVCLDDHSTALDRKYQGIFAFVLKIVCPIPSHCQIIMWKKQFA